MHTTLAPMRALAAAVALLAIAATTAAAQTGTLVGMVLVDGVERPITGADVVIGGTGLEARTDSAGRFTVAGVPRGNHVVGVRALGFAPGAWKITFTDGERVEIDFLLTAAVQSLEKVEVKASEGVAPSIALKMSGFLERQKFGEGRFIEQDVLEKARGRRLAEVLTGRIPGFVVLVHPRTGRRFLGSNRRTTGPQCSVRVIMDGLTHPGPDPFWIDNIDPGMVAGVEFYSVATTPPQFNGTGTAPCGTLVIWSRG